MKAYRIDTNALSNINRALIGFDQLFDSLEGRLATAAQNNYPPFNILQTSDNEYQIEIAIAGFKKEDIRVYTEHGKLFVEANKEAKETDICYIHRGLAQRNFKKAWALADDTEVKEVTFENGLLRVELRKIVPDHHARKDYL